MTPSSTPIVAGTAPASRTAASLARPTSTPSGAGNPCATSVVSSATTASPASSAARTSSPTTMSSLTRAPTRGDRAAREAGALVEAHALLARPDDEQLHVLVRGPGGDALEERGTHTLSSCSGRVYTFVRYPSHRSRASAGGSSRSARLRVRDDLAFGFGEPDRPATARDSVADDLVERLLEVVAHGRDGSGSSNVNVRRISASAGRSAAVAVRIATFIEPPSLASGIAPTCCTQRAAASRARSGPPTIHPAASASPAPVVSTTCATGRAGRSSPSNEHPRAPRFEIHCTPGQRTAEDLLLSFGCEDDVRCDLRDRIAELDGSRVPDGAPGCEVDAHRGSLRSRDLGGALRGAPDRLDHERVPRDEQVIAAFEPCGIELVLAKLARSSAVGCHRALAVRRHERADDAVSALDRPEDFDTLRLEPGECKSARPRRLPALRLAVSSRRASPPRRPRLPPDPQGRRGSRRSCPLPTRAGLAAGRSRPA